MEKIKILFVGYRLLPHRPEAVCNVTRGLAEALGKRGFEVIILTNGNKDEKSNYNGVTTVQVATGSGLFSFFFGITKFRNRIRDLINEYKPDILHDMFVIPGSSLIITNFALKRSKLLPVTIKTSWNYPSNPYHILDLLRPFNYRYFLEELIFRIMLGNKNITKVAYSKFDSLLIHNKYEKSKYKEIIKGKSIEYLPLGIRDIKIKGDRINFPKTNYSKKILYFGHPSVKKGVYELISTVPKILKKSKDAMICFYFSEVAESKEGIIEKIDLLSKKYPNRVFYRVGYFNAKELYKYFDLLVLPLRHEWASTSPPITIIEAGSVGLSTITENLDITKEAADYYDGVRLVHNMLNKDNLAESILCELENLKQVNNKSTNDWNQQVSSYVNFYENLLQKGKKFYDNKNLVKNYDQNRFQGRGGGYLSNKEVSSLIGTFSFKNHKIADFGTGTGRVVIELLRKNILKIFAVDSSRHMLNMLKKRTRVSKGKLKLVHSGVNDLKMKKNSVDIVTALRLFEHLPQSDKQNFFTKAQKILISGGKLSFSFLNKNSLENMLLSYRKSKSPVYPDRLEEVIALLKKEGFEIEEVKYDFIVPRVIFKRAISLLLSFFMVLEDLAIKTPLKKYASHITIIAKTKT